jgi:hypothetical protein|tara:strand:+ start:214 stop:351 length:138 start_codon:yes stop_codon:yes gene_type:complete
MFMVARIRNYQNRGCEKSAARRLRAGAVKTSRRGGFVTMCSCAFA